jgi:hypothetical protein
MTRPRHRLGEPRQRRRQLLHMRAGDPIQLPLQHTADGGLLLFRPILQHVDVMPRQPDAQLRCPDYLRSKNEDWTLRLSAGCLSTASCEEPSHQP